MKCFENLIMQKVSCEEVDYAKGCKWLEMQFVQYKNH